MTIKKIIKLANLFINKYGALTKADSNQIKTFSKFSEEDQNTIRENYNFFIEEFDYLNRTGKLDFLKDIDAGYRAVKTQYDVLTRLTSFGTIIMSKPGGMGGNNRMVTELQRHSKDHPELTRMLTHLRIISDIVDAKYRDDKEKEYAMRSKVREMSNQFYSNRPKYDFDSKIKRDEARQQRPPSPLGSAFRIGLEEEQDEEGSEE